MLTIVGASKVNGEAASARSIEPDPGDRGRLTVGSSGGLPSAWQWGGSSSGAFPGQAVRARVCNGTRSRDRGRRPLRPPPPGWRAVRRPRALELRPAHQGSVRELLPDLAGQAGRLGLHDLDGRDRPGLLSGSWFAPRRDRRRIWMVLFYTASAIWPENNPFLDDHVVEFIILLALAYVGAGRYLGLDAGGRTSRSSPPPDSSAPARREPPGSSDPEPGPPQGRQDGAGGARRPVSCHDGSEKRSWLPASRRGPTNRRSGDEHQHFCFR